ncbi:LLM class flavin-dependent oxidoreductase [Nocardia sp. CA-128927]|uniref:LLM class flavin-dependent oxidoreductase n=1 Tax=Nocardia sp. CA-128927 TaxID=3239975 RepID=UPI003D95E6A8
MSHFGVSIPMRGLPMRKIPEYARRAEEAGFRSLWAIEVNRSPFTQLAMAAAVTSRIGLGTAVAQAFPHSPFAMANIVADIDEISEGRAILGIGPGVPALLRVLHSDDAQNLVGRMREFIDVVRTSWEYQNSEGDVSCEGRHYSFRGSSIDPFRSRSLARPRIPMYLGAMGPQMLRLAGEKADGVIGALLSPSYIEDHIRPNLARGAERSNRDPASIEIVSLAICAVSHNREEAMRRARLQVGAYLALPSVTDSVVKFYGLEREQEALRIALYKSGFAALEETDDKLVEAFAVAGTPKEVKGQLKEYQRTNPHIILHAPYMSPLTDEEIEDGFRSILDAFADSGQE